MHQRGRTKVTACPSLGTMFACLICLLCAMTSLRQLKVPAKTLSAEPGQQLVEAKHAATEERGLVSPAIKISHLVDSPQTSSTRQQDAKGDSDQGSEDSATSELNPLANDQALHELLSLVQDNTTTLQRIELPAYWKILGAVVQTETDVLRQSATVDIPFRHLMTSPGKFRSTLVSEKVQVRRISRYEVEDNEIAGINQLFEVWGTTESSKNWLCVFVTPDLPEGLAVGESMNVASNFFGYFFKLQGYQPGNAQPNAKAIPAPLYLGKFEGVRPSLPNGRVTTMPESMIMTLVAVLAILVVLARILWSFQRKSSADYLKSNRETVGLMLMGDPSDSSSDDNRKSGSSI